MSTTNNSIYILPVKLQVIHSTQNNLASKTNTLMIKLKTNSI